MEELTTTGDGGVSPLPVAPVASPSLRLEEESSPPVSGVLQVLDPFGQIEIWVPRSGCRPTRSTRQVPDRCRPTRSGQVPPD